MFEVVETIVNPLDGPMDVCVEPWADVYPLAPGESLRVVAVSEQQGELEVVRGESQVTIYAWSGSTARVYRDDQLVGDLNLRFPELPPGMSTRSFVEFLFTGPA